MSISSIPRFVDERVHGNLTRKVELLHWFDFANVRQQMRWALRGRWCSRIRTSPTSNSPLHQAQEDRRTIVRPSKIDTFRSSNKDYLIRRQVTKISTLGENARLVRLLDLREEKHRKRNSVQRSLRAVAAKATHGRTFYHLSTMENSRSHCFHEGQSIAASISHLFPPGFWVLPSGRNLSFISVSSGGRMLSIKLC